MAIALDLTKRQWTKQRGPLLAIGTWISQDSGKTFRPCIALIRAGDDGSDRAVPCVVTLDRAWIWSEEVGDPGQAARTAFDFTIPLRLEGPDGVIMIAGFIADLLDDLLTGIPPYQPTNGNAVADVVVTNRETGKSIEDVIRDV